MENINFKMKEFNDAVLNKTATWWQMNLPSGDVFFGSAKATMLGYPESAFKNYKDFVKIDRRDIGVGQDRSGQQVGKCLSYCDYVLTNNKEVKDFEKKIEKLLVHKLFSSSFVGK